MSTQTEAKQEIAGQTKPPGLFHLPGVEPRHAEQAEEAHGGGFKDVDDCPWVVVTDERTFRWMDRLNDHVK